MKSKICNIEDDDDGQRKKSKTLHDDGVDDFSESGWIDSVYGESFTNDQNSIREFGGSADNVDHVEKNNKVLDPCEDDDDNQKMLLKESGGQDKTECSSIVVKRKKDDDKEDDADNGGEKKIPISSLVIDFTKYFLVVGNGSETQINISVRVDVNQETENSIENQESGDGSASSSSSGMGVGMIIGMVIVVLIKWTGN